MKYLALAVAAAGVATALSISGDPKIAARSNAAAVSTAVEVADIFTLRARGSNQSCAVRKSPSDGPRATLIVEPKCDAVLPGLSRVRHWQELDDGSVIFSTDGSETVISFSVADGVAYESFEPRSPLISLISEN